MNLPRNKDDDKDDDRDDTWERLQPKVRKPLVRKPPKILNWFAEEPDNLQSSSSEESLVDGEEEWETIERKKRNENRRQVRKLRKKNKMTEIATKMRHTVGVGPIQEASVEFFIDSSKNEAEAEVKAIKEYLNHNLDFNRVELDRLEIVDTRRGAKDNIIYFAVKDEQQVREIHFRKALCANEHLIIRDYIPPQFYGRFMAVSNRAKEKREKDKSLKTQIRWGTNDIEIYTKERGKEEQFKKTSLREFMGDEILPEFDMSIKWLPRNSNRTRRKLAFKKPGDLPSLRNIPKGKLQTIHGKTTQQLKVGMRQQRN